MCAETLPTVPPVNADNEASPKVAALPRIEKAISGVYGFHFIMPPKAFRPSSSRPCEVTADRCGDVATATLTDAGATRGAVDGCMGPSPAGAVSTPKPVLAHTVLSRANCKNVGAEVVACPLIRISSTLISCVVVPPCNAIKVLFARLVVSAVAVGVQEVLWKSRLAMLQVLC